MSYGTPEWQGWVLDEEQSLPLLEHAYKAGLNTWDTVRNLLNSVINHLSSPITDLALRPTSTPTEDLKRS